MTQNKKCIFTPNVTHQALDIMNGLSSRPCAKPFINFFPNVEKIKLKSELLCLNLITEKLKSHKYNSPAEWHRDMKLIPANCAILFPNDKNIILLANQLFLRFEKEFEFFVSYSAAKWSKLIGILSYRLIYKMAKQPPENIFLTTEINAALIQNFPFISNSYFHKNQGQNSEAIQNNSDALLEETEPDSFIYLTQEEKEVHDKNNFLKAVSALKSKNDAKEIVDIIVEEQPNINIEEPNPIIQFNELENSTINKLIVFVKKRYNELGLKYPK